MGNYQSQPSRISERSADPAPIELSSRLIGAGQGISTLVEMPLQISSFLTNKPNLVRRRRIANERKHLLYKGLSNFHPAGGAKKQTQFKPKQTQFKKSPNEYKLNYNKGLQKKR